MRLVDQVDEVLGRRVSMRSLALLRMLVGPVVVVHLWPFVSDALDGRTYHDTFHEAYAPWYPELSPGPYSVLLYVGVVAAVAMTLGVATRVTSAVTFGVVAYNVFLSTTHFHNNRAFLMIVLAGLAVGPCGRELSVDEWWHRRRGLPPLDTSAPAWPLWLLRFEACVLYGASGLSKLLDPDWFGGTVTHLRVVHHRADLGASPLPDWALDLLLDRSFHTFAAKAIVLTELAIAAGLWSQTTRRAAIWLAVCFHVAIQLTAEVEVFSYLALAALVIWATPSTRDRTLAVAPTSRLSRAVHQLDWLARFNVTVPPAPAAAPGITGAPTGRRDSRPTAAVPVAVVPDDGLPGFGSGSPAPGPASASAIEDGPAPALVTDPSAAPPLGDGGGRPAAGAGSPARARDRRAAPVPRPPVARAGTTGVGSAEPVGGDDDGPAVASADEGSAVVAAVGADQSAEQVGPSGDRSGAEAGGSHAVVLWDRDGSVRTGRGATLFALSRLPLIAWFFLPALLLPSVRRSRRSAVESTSAEAGRGPEPPALGDDPAAGAGGVAENAGLGARDQSVSAVSEEDEG